MLLLLHRNRRNIDAEDEACHLQRVGCCASQPEAPHAVEEEETDQETTRSQLSSATTDSSAPMHVQDIKEQMSVLSTGRVNITHA